ncbi:GGDEF domain-containing protein [Cytobacillus oceanisediminis]|uniref:GGDEF domain-containing protein n=1 Tax=Cytobacillus oceanisediminis TaxID=665099 RepID=UPI00207B03F4|nr:diguanylate cyclase [Cytobacillus oceanisediminis]USK42074.1 diguanylate cyclase [Cytobacillus oceanisediminis]
MKEWDKESLRNYLFDLIEMSYEYEHFQTVKQQNPIRAENAPLIKLIDDDISMLILLKDALEGKSWMVIVMISVKAFRETRITSYKMGADDFISKPIDLEEFLIKIERHLENKKLFDQSSMIDELTRVYNRGFFNDSILIFMNELSRNQRLSSLAMRDIDFFKKVNDTYGHPTVDMVLVEFVKYLKENVRQTDYVFRYGGEEFIILFSGATGDEGKIALEKILIGFSEKRFEVGGNSFSVPFSAGVFMVDESGMEKDLIIRAVDQALYEGKQKGRARVEYGKLDSFAQNKKKLHVSVINDDSIIRMMLTRCLVIWSFIMQNLI